jgi:oligopeptide/dipeptide ABC transporter ATP-binding protein
VVHAVDGVELQIAPGEAVGLVGESGCGKSMTALSIMGLIEKPGKTVSGHIFFKGTDLRAMTPDQLRALRGKEISMIFQDPMMCLNPVFTVGDQVAEVLRMHREDWGQTRIVLNEILEVLGLPVEPRQLSDVVVRQLSTVGIPTPRDRLGNYPHQFSGGMRQRVMIATALACGPSLLIADEPTTALDVTIQAQILALINELRKELGMAMVLITHDLGVVAENCDRVYVMYAGKVVEQADLSELFNNPRHPYTMGLLKAIPDMTTEKEWLYTIPGSVPDLIGEFKGCPFAPRCEYVFDLCREQAPPMVEVMPGHWARCHLARR